VFAALIAVVVAAVPPAAPDAYLGVACPAPNSIACDRVGLAVWLDEPAERVVATIGDRTFALDDERWPDDPRGEAHIGYLQPAGLTTDGPLHVEPDEPPDRLVRGDAATPRVTLRITRKDGGVDTTVIRAGLHPGWG
jgi:dipeptidyl aminopeptidase/acylaminoacyl peptidase